MPVYCYQHRAPTTTVNIHALMSCSASISAHCCVKSGVVAAVATDAMLLASWLMIARMKKKESLVLVVQILLCLHFPIPWYVQRRGSCIHLHFLEVGILVVDV